MAGEGAKVVVNYIAEELSAGFDYTCLFKR